MKIKLPVDHHISKHLKRSGVSHGKNVRVDAASYTHFANKVIREYPQLSEPEQKALAVLCCLTHPDHKHLHISNRWRWILAGVALLASIVFLATAARAQGTSQIDVITFVNSGGTTVKSFAAPFKIKCSTNVTCAASGSTLTITATGGAGGGGYATIQNAGTPITQETVLNFLGALACVDNAANTSSDCTISANIAVTHQFLTGIDSSGNFTRAAILAADVPTLNQSTSGNAGTATALAANPTDCSANQYANAIDAGGNLTCAQVAYSQVTSTPQLAQTLANSAHKWFNSYTASTGLFTQTQPDYSDLTGTPQLAVTKTCTGTDKVSAYDSTTGLFTCTTDQTGAGGSTPTGTGFTHITSGVQDGAAKTVDVSSSDITGVLATSAEPAHTGDVTNSAGSLALTIGAGKVTRADEAADAVGWQFLCTATTATTTVTCTPSTARKHNMCRLIITSYAGGGGVARAEFGNTSTPDTGTNYAFGGFSIASGTSATPTVSGIGSAATAQEGVPVSGSTTTTGRFVQLQISNSGTNIKYFTIETSGIGASAAVTPNLAHIAGTWNNTTSGIGVIQFKACTATTGTCTTLNMAATLTCWGRDDN